MSLLQQIKDASLTARKQKDSMAAFLVTLYAEAARVGKDKGQRDSTDEEVIAVLEKFKKGAREIIETAQDNPSDYANTLAAEAQQEILLLEQYLPKQLSEDELTAIINGYVVSTPDVSAKSMGLIMGKLKQEHGGLYDGSLASRLVKEALSALA